MMARKAALITAISVFILDQITKILVLKYVAGQSIAVLPFFNLVHVWNTGISFGMLKGGEGLMPYILSAVSLVICALLVFWASKTEEKHLKIAIAAVIGGALGNVIDRLLYGAVVDFLDFHAFGWHYPAFNIADSAIVLGIAFILFDSLFLEPKRNKSNEEQHEHKAAD